MKRKKIFALIALLMASLFGSSHAQNLQLEVIDSIINDISQPAGLIDFYRINATFSPQGDAIIITSSFANEVKTWNIASKKLENFEKNNNPYFIANYSPDGKYIAAGEPEKITIWDANTGKVIHTIDWFDWISAIEFSPDGQYLAASSNNGIGVWAVAAWKEIDGWYDSKRPSSFINDIAFSPDGHYLASGSSDGNATVWSFPSGATAQTFTEYQGNINKDNVNQSSVNAVAFSPNGAYLAIGGANEQIDIWEMSTAEKSHTFKNHQGVISAIEFSPDGTYLATSSGDKSIKIWEMATGNELANLERNGLAHSLSFSPDGRYLASAESRHNQRNQQGERISEVFLWATPEQKAVFCSAEGCATQP